MKRKETYEEKKGKFLDMLLSADKDQLSDFIKNKGRKPKMIKPFICLSTRVNQ